MNPDLSPEQIARYLECGFLQVPNLLSTQEVEELKAGVLEAVDATGLQRVAGQRETELAEGNAYYDRVFKQRLNLWRINSVVRRYMLSPELGRMLCTLANVRGLRVWHDQALIKEPFGNPTPWHLDNPIWFFPTGHKHLDRSRGSHAG